MPFKLPNFFGKKKETPVVPQQQMQTQTPPADFGAAQVTPEQATTFPVAPQTQDANVTASTFEQPQPAVDPAPVSVPNAYQPLETPQSPAAALMGEAPTTLVEPAPFAQPTTVLQDIVPGDGQTPPVEPVQPPVIGAPNEQPVQPTFENPNESQNPPEVRQ